MSHQTRYYFGDLPLWREGIDHVESDEIGEQEEHHGTYRARALHTQDSPNVSLGLDVICLGAPSPTAKNQRGWRSTYRAVREALRARMTTAYPVVWVEDDSTARTVGGYAAPTVTCNGHGLSNGDVVLIRRNGVGLFSLATVGGAAANTFTVTAIGTTALHAIQAGDEIWLVEAYWLGMFYKGLAPAPMRSEGCWYADQLVYRFRGSGTYTYERTTTAHVGT